MSHDPDKPRMTAISKQPALIKSLDSAAELKHSADLNKENVLNGVQMTQLPYITTAQSAQKIQEPLITDNEVAKRERFASASGVYEQESCGGF